MTFSSIITNGNFFNFRITDLQAIANILKNSTSNGGDLSLPDKDGYCHIYRNGAFYKAYITPQPEEWDPEIAPDINIVITADEDMTPFQLTGRNLEVNTVVE